jgi:uncharacterized paraquat-inducible protein A
MIMAKTKEPDRLAMEASMAIEAGMSYGQWKGLQYEKHKPVKVEKGIPEGWKVCTHCGKAYKANRSDQKYCDIHCQRQAIYERQKLRKAVAENGQA